MSCSIYGNANTVAFGKCAQHFQAFNQLNFKGRTEFPVNKLVTVNLKHTQYGQSLKTFKIRANAVLCTAANKNYSSFAVYLSRKEMQLKSKHHVYFHTQYITFISNKLS